MKKVVTVLAVLGSLIIILSSLQFDHALTMFLLVGLVPGTDIVVSPGQMFMAVGLIAGFALARLVTPPLRRLVSVQR